MNEEVAQLKTQIDRAFEQLAKVNDVETAIRILPRMVRIANLFRKALEELQNEC